MAPWKKLATLACILTGLTLGAMAPASATNFSTDNSDLWWNPAENGWGMQMVQRADIIFVTLYVYSTSSTPVWYAAVLTATGATQWNGDLMRTSGPWYGAKPFNPMAVSVAKVGAMTYIPTSLRDGVLTYSIDGISVTTHIERMTLRYDNYNGNYIGLLSYASESCPNFSDLGVHNNRIDFSITQSDSSMSIVSQQQGTVAVCTSSGLYEQDGQFGSTRQTTGSCTDGSGTGAVTNFYEMTVSPSGIAMRFTAPNSNPGQNGCTFDGSLVGIRQ
jgi:hypothetical protein